MGQIRRIRRISRISRKGRRYLSRHTDYRNVWRSIHDLRFTIYGTANDRIR